MPCHGPFPTIARITAGKPKLGPHNHFTRRYGRRGDERLMISSTMTTPAPIRPKVVHRALWPSGGQLVSQRERSRVLPVGFTEDSLMST